MIDILYPSGTLTTMDTKVPPTLEQLKEWVEGYIERIPSRVSYQEVQAFCNENGIAMNLDYNRRASNLFGQSLYGTIVVLTGPNRVD